VEGGGEGGGVECLCVREYVENLPRQIMWAQPLMPVGNEMSAEITQACTRRLWRIVLVLGRF
jgi:hypothetical protein